MPDGFIGGLERGFAVSALVGLRLLQFGLGGLEVLHGSPHVRLVLGADGKRPGIEGGQGNGKYQNEQSFHPLPLLMEMRSGRIRASETHVNIALRVFIGAGTGMGISGLTALGARRQSALVESRISSHNHASPDIAEVRIWPARPLLRPRPLKSRKALSSSISTRPRTSRGSL